MRWFHQLILLIPWRFCKTSCSWLQFQDVHADHLWWTEKWIDNEGNPRWEEYHPHRAAPTCVPCSYTADTSKLTFPHPRGCPCTTATLCNADKKGDNSFHASYHKTSCTVFAAIGTTRLDALRVFAAQGSSSGAWGVSVACLACPYGHILCMGAQGQSSASVYWRISPSRLLKTV